MEERLYTRLLILLAVWLKVTEQLDSKIIEESNASPKILSRRKRFLIFPEGSSLQLVYCLTIPSIGMGSIFTIGWTAALAWELPHEPIHPYRKKGEGALRRVDKPGSSSSGGWTLQKGSTSTSDNTKKKTYYGFSSVNYPSSPYSTIKDYLTKPGYSKIRYTGSPDTSYRENFKGKYVDYRPIYDALAFSPSLKSNNVMKEAAHPVYKEVHRRTRRDLFSKIEKFLDAQRQDGKACLLKAICEVSKSPSNEVGTFTEEIIKAIFRIKPYKNDYDQDAFDSAADESQNCTEKYSRCSSSVWSLL